MPPDLPNFSGARSYLCFIMTNLWIKHVEDMKIFTGILIATHLRIIVNKHMIIKYEKYPTS